MAEGKRLVVIFRRRGVSLEVADFREGPIMPFNPARVFAFSFEDVCRSGEGCRLAKAKESRAFDKARARSRDRVREWFALRAVTSFMALGDMGMPYSM